VASTAACSLDTTDDFADVVTNGMMTTTACSSSAPITAVSSRPAQLAVERNAPVPTQGGDREHSRLVSDREESLNNLGAMLSDLGQREAALAEIREPPTWAFA
jgi:hypothetical protein